MKRFFVEFARAGEPVFLSPEEGRHAVRVLRLRTGDRVVLFDGTGKEWAARVEEAGKRVRVLPEDSRPGIAHTGITIAAACPKGKRLEFMVEKLAETGVRAFLPVRFDRSVVGMTSARRARLERTARAASKQCGRADLLSIREEIRPDALRGPRLFLADPGSDLPVPNPASEPSTVVIGPEGGLTAEERAALEKAGAVFFSLGPRILRIETAAVAGAILFSRNHA